MPLGLERSAEQIGGIRSVFGYQDAYVSILASGMLISDDNSLKFAPRRRFLRLSSDSLAPILL